MPYMTNGKRDYKKENEKYKSRPDQVKKREERNAARQAAIKAGKVHVGDGTSIDHIVPLSKHGSLSKSNQRIVPVEVNSSFERNPDGSVKANIPKSKRKGK